MVWSAFKFTDAKLSSRENSAPISAATSMASSSKPCNVTQSPASLAAAKVPASCIYRTKYTPTKAPKIIIPSSARLMMPLRSANTPASATIMRGMA